MTDAITVPITAIMVLDARYRWWWRRAVKPGKHLPSAGMLDSTDEDGTKHVLVPVSCTRFGRLMRSEGLTGDCRPGRYLLVIAEGVPPRLENILETI